MVKTFAQFDDAGFPLAFWREDGGVNPPADAVEISESAWRNFLDNPNERRWNGSKPVKAARPQPDIEQEPSELEVLKHALKSEGVLTDEKMELARAAKKAEKGAK